MTREHLFFIPFIYFLGFIVGSLSARERPAHTSVARSGRQLLVAGLLVLLVFIATHALATHGGARHTSDLLGGQALFDQRPSFHAEEVYQRIARFGDAGRDAYRKMTYTSDLIFPLVLFYFLFRLARHVAHSVTSGSALAGSAMTSKLVNLAPIVPLLWLVTDLGENAMVHTLLRKFPERNDALAGMLGFVTDVKFTLLVASVVVPAVLLWGRRGSRKKTAVPDIRREIVEELLKAEVSLKTSLEVIERLERLPVLSNRETFALHCLRHLLHDEDLLRGDLGAQNYQRKLLGKLARRETI